MISACFSYSYAPHLSSGQAQKLILARLIRPDEVLHRNAT